MEELNSEKIRDAAIIMVRADPGKTAADIGAAEGFITEGLLNAGCSVIAVDSSQAMTEILKQRFGHMKEVRIVQSGDSPLNLPDGCVDYVFCHMHLSRCDTPEKTIAELKRIAKPGGKIAVTDLLFHVYESLAREAGFKHNGFTLPDIYIWFAQTGIKNISVENAGSIELPGGIRLEMFLAYGEKQD